MKYNAEVLYPYTQRSSKKVDVKAQITIIPEYSGSGWNFLINFPGFLVWAPAWHGYNYNVTYKTKIHLYSTADKKTFAILNIPIYLNVRHADICRTWTEISWLEVGIIALIGGIVFIGYDDDVTPLLIEETQLPLGDYLAARIVSCVNAHQVPIAKVSSTVSYDPATGLPERDFPRRNIAVAPLDAISLSHHECLTLSEALRVTLVNTDYFTVVSRADLDRILKEQAFQYSDLSDTEHLVEFGRILAVEKIVGGTVGRVGDTFSIAVHMLDVESGCIDISVVKDVSGIEDRLLETMRVLGRELAIKYASSKGKEPNK
jgi:hypothetical protein